MSKPRPRSWYAVSQPYTNHAPGQQAPLPPGAPDFPPVSAAPTSTASRAIPPQYQDGVHFSQQGHQHGYNFEHQNVPPVYASMPLATSQNGGPPARAAAMGSHWSPGHQTRHSQPVLPTQHQTPGSYPTLSSPQIDAPIRARSPKLGSQHVPNQSRQNSAGPLHDPSQIARIRSPQPRRNTVPSPILPEGDLPSSASVSAPQVPLLGGRRPLPAPPGRTNGQASLSSLDFSASSSPSVSPSVDLSRSPSAASSASVSSSGSTRRRPLPQPPSLSGALSKPSPTTNPPVSYAEAQAAVSRNTFPSHQYPGGTRGYQTPPQAEPLHVQDVRSRVEQMTIKAREAADRRSSPVTSASSERGPKAPAAVNVPAISVPSFSFDEPDQPSSSAVPAISIAVAPPSPSFKATTSEYFGTQLEDEHVPLPSSSVPMATSTRAHATACPKCERPVLYGRTVNAMGKRWHPDCFVCEQCETKLEHMEFFTKDGSPYCHVDYHEVSGFRLERTHSRLTYLIAFLDTMQSLQNTYSG